MNIKFFAKNKGITVAITLALVIATWCVAELVNIPLFFATSAIFVIVAGVLISLGDSTIAKEIEEQSMTSREELLEKLEQISNDVATFKSSIVDALDIGVKGIMTSVEDSGNSMCRKFDDAEKNIIHALDKLEKSISDNAIASESARAENKTAIINAISEARTNLNKAVADSKAMLDSKAEQIKTGIKKVAESVENMHEETEEQIESIIPSLTTVMLKNRKEQAAVMAKMSDDLTSVAASFENSVEAYQEMENRMALLEQQNVHLQLLTTAIGTIRADIAAINEVNGFIDEHKAGRKIRIVRDDEHGVVVENLMTSDGVGIEKSKMYKNKQLVFEAEFDMSGKMRQSRSYDKSGSVATEVTYSANGQTVTRLLKAAKNKVADAMSRFKK